MSEGYKYDNSRDEMLKYFSGNIKTVLEVGCGTGKFAGLLNEKFGTEVWGIEKDRNAASIAGKTIKKIYTGDIAEIIAELPQSYFNAVVFLDVLEHLYDPVMILKRVRDLLTEDGVIIASIPNIRYYHFLTDFLIKKNWDYTDYGILDFTHIRFFTVNSIPKMFTDAGYNLRKIEGINPTPSKKLKLLNFVLFNFLSDSKYLQFACVAQKQNKENE